MVKKSIIVVIGVFLLFILPCISEEEKTSPEVKKVTLAVFDFKITSETEKTVIKSGSGQLSIEYQKESSVLTDKFITALVKTNKFKIVERDKLDTVMKELALTQSGLTDPKHSQKIGKLLGADYLLHGSISMFDANVKYTDIPYTNSFNKITEAQMAVDIRLVETETGKIVSAETTNEKVQQKEVVDQKGYNDNIPKSLIEELQRKIVNSLTADVVDAIYPVKIASVKDDVLFLNRGEDGIKKGDILRVILRGKEIRDPDTNSLIGFEDTEIAEIEVVEVLPKLSKAKVVKWKQDEKENKKEIPKGAICLRVKEKEEKKDPGEKSPSQEKHRLPGTDE